MLTPTDLGGDENLARRVLVRARSIAPCIDSLTDGPGDDDPKPKSDAIAILKGVIAEIPAAGSRRVRSKSRNGTSITYADIASAFTADDVAALRSLCSAVTSGLPVGSFPTSRPVGRVWPEGDYT